MAEMLTLQRPDIKAPRWMINVYNETALAPGYWFIAPYASLKQDEHRPAWVGPHIYDQSGELVWSGSPTFKRWNTFDFGVTTVDNNQMLSLLFSHDNSGVILDKRYQTFSSVALGESKDVSDMHDFNVIDDGRTALVTTKTFQNASLEVSQIVGFDGNCFAKYEGFRELILEGATSQSVFEWRPQDHIGLAESTFKPGPVEDMCSNGWDIMHSNAIDKFPDGDYLLSARHTDALYKISRLDGSILWRLGGVDSDFDFIGDAKFSRQHHARVYGQNETHILISLFDNAVGTGAEEHPTQTESRGLLLALSISTTERMTAEMVAEFKHPRGEMTNSRGSLQILPNANAFLCWTYLTRISEHTLDGNLLIEASLRAKKHSYRAYKSPWVVIPIQMPDVYSKAVTLRDAVSTVIHVSWNGATEVSTWNLYKTDLKDKEYLIAVVPRQGFETAIVYPGYAKYVIAEAVDADGNSIRRSDIVSTIPPASAMFSPAIVQEAQWTQGYIELEHVSTIES